MSAPALKLTDPKEIGPIEKVTELVELPFAQNGRKPVFQIKALSGSDLVRIRGTDEDRVVAVMAETAVLAPPLSFGEEREPGKLWWNDLLPGNQEGLLKAINRLSGIGVSPDGEAAKRTASFPAESGRRADGPAPAAHLLPAGASA